MATTIATIGWAASATAVTQCSYCNFSNRSSRHFCSNKCSNSSAQQSVNSICQTKTSFEKTIKTTWLTLRAESPSIFLEKSGRGSAGREQSLLPLPDFSRKIEGDSARSVEYRTRFLQWREDVNCWPKYRKHALLLNKMVKIFPRFHTKMLKTRTSNSMRVLSTIARIIAVLAHSTEPTLSCDKHWNLQVIQLDQK